MKEPDLVALRCQCCGEWRWLPYKSVILAKHHFCKASRCMKERYKLHNREVRLKAHPTHKKVLCLRCGVEYSIPWHLAKQTTHPYCINPECQQAAKEAKRLRHCAYMKEYGKALREARKAEAQEETIRYTARKCLKCGKPVEYHELDEYWHCDRCRERMSRKAARFDNNFLYCADSTFDNLLDIYTPEM